MHSGNDLAIGSLEREKNPAKTFVLNVKKKKKTIPVTPTIIVHNVDSLDESLNSEDTCSFKSDLETLDYERLSQYSLEMRKDFRYYFQHPYSRLFIAYFVVLCNFFIYAEDPVAHSFKPCYIPVIGNAFSFVASRYPSNAFAALKVFLWICAILTGIVVGKLIHVFVFNRALKLKMFINQQGSWMTMFMSSILSLFLYSWLYNGFLLAAGMSTESYLINSNLGINNHWFMKAAATGTWLGDFFTAWMVTDVMLQEKLYPHWAARIRRQWSHSSTRVVIFWIIVVTSTSLVVTFICMDYISWDNLNNGFLPSDELGRAFLASFILVFDLLIVMQDWDFPHFVNGFKLKLPGLNMSGIKFTLPLPKCVTNDWWEVRISGKWFNYGIIFMVIILDLNMWKTQIFYEPFEFGQYVNDVGQIFTVRDPESLANATREELKFDYRTKRNNSAGVYLVALDSWMYSRYKGYHLSLKIMAFLPSMLAFFIFIALIYQYGRYEVSEKNPYFRRMKKKHTISNIALAGMSRSTTNHNIPDMTAAASAAVTDVNTKLHESNISLVKSSGILVLDSVQNVCVN